MQVSWSATFQHNKLSISTKKIASQNIFTLSNFKIAHVGEAKTELRKHFGIIVAQMYRVW